jgi:hypothetical protein
VGLGQLAAILLLLLLAGGILVLAATTTPYFYRSPDRGRLLTRLQRDLAAAQVDEASGDVVGRLGNWPLRLQLGEWNEQGYPLDVHVQLPHAASFSLQIRRADSLGWVLRRFGRIRDVKVDHGSEFDEAHLVEASGRGAVEPLARADVRAQVDRLLKLRGVHALRIHEGQLSVNGVLPGTFGKRPIKRLYDAVLALARCYDRRPAVEVQIDLQQRFVWTGGGEHARCPYCHDQLGRVDLVACDACGTLLHADCQAENKGCPVLGCGETAWSAVHLPA